MYLIREEESKVYPLLNWKEALVLIGPRRAGKTTLAKKLLKNWQEKEKGIYIDMESLDAPKDMNDLNKLISNLKPNSLIVLDEIQVLKNWEKIVRHLIENTKYNLLLTGSSASLLSKEIASSLAGRAIPEQILTLSYKNAKLWGIKSLEEYLKVGGYTECVLRPNDAERLHKLYLELTILRDVAARKRIRDIKPLSDLAIILLSEPGKTISSSKTSKKIGISEPTFRSYVQALNDAYLILSVPPYLRSPRERVIADSKHYAYDLGLQKSTTVSTEKDIGRRLENLVAIELERRGFRLSYAKGKDWECDFIAQKTGEHTIAIQVWSGDTLPDRELKGLQKGMKLDKTDKGFILSLKEMKSNKTMTIEKWLLRDE